MNNEYQAERGLQSAAMPEFNWVPDFSRARRTFGRCCGLKSALRSIALACFSVSALFLNGIAHGQVLYTNNFDSAELGKVPDDFLVLAGDFAVKAEDGNKFLELPGSPLDSFGVQFGPGGNPEVSVSARIKATARGRRFPICGVGLNGVAGYRLQVSPGKKLLELYRDQELKGSAPFEWKSDSWTKLRLRVHKDAAGGWRIEGKAWTEGSAEPP